jgi:hypothetical protein
MVLVASIVTLYDIRKIRDINGEVRQIILVAIRGQNSTAKNR